MTEQSLRKRLLELEKAIEQSMANLNMLIGGKQEVLYWLGQFQKPDKPMELNELKQMLGADSIELVDKAG